MDIREETRDAAELRFAAMDALRAVSEFVKSNKPSVLLEGATSIKGGGEIVGDEEKRAMWRDWINFTKDVFEKQKELPYLMIEDIANMYKKRKDIVGQQTRASESK